MVHSVIAAQLSNQGASAWVMIRNFAGVTDGMGLSPIVVDVDHTGFEMTDAANGVLFNILGDNVPLSISWTGVNATTAFLVLDRDNIARSTSEQNYLATSHRNHCLLHRMVFWP